MVIRYTKDIHTKKDVYVLCDFSGNAKYLTTSITKAIKLAQGKK